MVAAPVRFISATAWPLTIWTSLSHFDVHPPDDYVERTSPIVATALAFWSCFVALIVFANPAVNAIGLLMEDGEQLVTFLRRTPGAIVGVVVRHASALLDRLVDVRVAR